MNYVGHLQVFAFISRCQCYMRWTLGGGSGGVSDDSSGLQADGARGTDTDRLPQHYERELFVRMEEKIKFPCEPNQTSVAFLNPCRRVSDPFTSSSLESAEHKRLLHQRPMLDICIVFLFAPLIFIYIYIYFFISHRSAAWTIISSLVTICFNSLWFSFGSFHMCFNSSCL